MHFLDLGGRRKEVGQKTISPLASVRSPSPGSSHELRFAPSVREEFVIELVKQVPTGVRFIVEEQVGFPTFLANVTAVGGSS
jgi:hypothetical protein